jgi:hypothetical protein
LSKFLQYEKTQQRYGQRVNGRQRLLIGACAIAFVAAGGRLTAGQIPRAEGLAAWQQVYSVLTHPRCINCHTATAYPQQGDDRRRHRFNVVRGQTGMGVPAFTCAACHQHVNADSTGVPGAPGWHLAPLSMQWQDMRGQIMSSGAVCRAVTIDRKITISMDLASSNITGRTRWSCGPFNQDADSMDRRGRPRR